MGDVAERHQILYEVERWRRYRTWLLLPATACVLTAVFITVLKPAGGGATSYVLVAALLYAFATSLWTRQRFSYLSSTEHALTVRTLAARRSVTTPEIERARVVRLGAIFNRSDRRGLLPRPAGRWLDTEAIAITMREGVDIAPFRRMVGSRCVIDGQLVVPVVDPQALVAQLHLTGRTPLNGSRSRRRRGRRR